MFINYYYHQSDIFRLRNLLMIDDELHNNLILSSIDISIYVSKAIGFLMGKALMKDKNATKKIDEITKNGLYVIKNNQKFFIIKPN